MSSDESFTRLQNALATLAEMAVRSQEVDAQHEARINKLEESNGRIAQTNRDLAESNRLIVEMLRRHDETDDELRAAQTGTEQKLAALVDAQIKAEDEMNKLRSAQAETGQKLSALVDAQIKAEDEMTQLRGALAELAGALTRLTVKVEAITGGSGRSSPE